MIRTAFLAAIFAAALGPAAVAQDNIWSEHGQMGGSLASPNWAQWAPDRLAPGAAQRTIPQNPAGGSPYGTFDDPLLRRGRSCGGGNCPDANGVAQDNSGLERGQLGSGQTGRSVYTPYWAQRATDGLAPGAAQRTISQGHLGGNPYGTINDPNRLCGGGICPDANGIVGPSP